MRPRLTLVCLLASLAPFSLLAQEPSPPKFPVGGPIAPKEKPPVGPAPTADDFESVEKLRTLRTEYQATLEKLYKYYAANNEREKAEAAAEELKQWHRINKYPYRLELDVPPPSLQPTYNVPEANALFKRAMEFKDHGIGTEAADNQRRAELLLQQLLATYPQCDKISRAAYQLGDIYENPPFSQKRRAAAYFERVYQWDPRTNTDARLRAARLYDKAGLDRLRAVEIYKAILNNETDANMIVEAERRIAVLTGKK